MKIREIFRDIVGIMGVFWTDVLQDIRIMGFKKTMSVILTTIGSLLFFMMVFYMAEYHFHLCPPMGCIFGIYG